MQHISISFNCSHSFAFQEWLRYNTDKFTVNATTGDTVIAGNLNLADDERIRLGTSNAFQIYYDSSAQAGQGQATISGGSHTKIGSTFFRVEGSGKTVIATDANNYVHTDMVWQFLLFN